MVALAAVQPDELSPLASYMASEINKNLHGPVVAKLKLLNAAVANQCIADFKREPLFWRIFASATPAECMRLEISNREAALLLWTWQVRENGEWDHKKIIRAQFKSPLTGSGYWHAYGSDKYYYDIWSNIHYGYVGRASGFSEPLLSDGAGLEQIGSSLVHFRTPIRSRGVSGLRAFDDDSDRESIMIGVNLHRKNGAGVTSSQLLREILSNPNLTHKPL